MDPRKWINEHGPIADFFNKFLAANDTEADQKEEKISFFSAFKPLGCVLIGTLLVGAVTFLLNGCQDEEALASVSHVNYLFAKN
ncbi:MAG: hypothetical protein K2Q32_03450 [Alphaproteobacteria bacterium]|nr:hypothetical protein [Alphaproteobacteria bacterium]